MYMLATLCFLSTFVCGTAETHETISIHTGAGGNVLEAKAVLKEMMAFVSLVDISEPLGIVSKELGEGMIGLCKGEICVPVRLDSGDDVLHDEGEMMVNADLISSVLNSKTEWVISGKALRFVPIDNVELDTLVEPGDVVPNFALPSISDGRMVSLSSFRGKRILLFLWASW